MILLSRIVLFLSFLISLINIFKFYNWYSKKTLDIVLDIDYFVKNGFELEKIYNFISDFKIDKVALDVKNLKGKDVKFFVILKFFSDEDYDNEQIYRCFDIYKGKIFSLIYLNKEEKKVIPEIKYSHQQLFKHLSYLNFVKLNFENFFNYRVFYPFRSKFSLRAFVCDLSLYRNNFLLKIKKAIKERSCSIIYIVPSEFISVEENLSIIQQISKELENSLSKKFVSFSTINFKVFSNLLGIFLAVFYPLFFYKKEFQNICNDSIFYSYFKINFLAIFLGIIIWGILQNYDYISFEKRIYGIKLAFILPLVFSFFIILNKKDFLKILSYNIKVKDFFLIVLVFIFLAYLVFRMGNVPDKFILVTEIKVREFIENFILFRPRFKEVFFTQPILYCSIFLIKQGMNLKNKLFFCFSILSVSSILNTFLHTHTPLHLCVLRSVLGSVLGLFFGVVYMRLYIAFEKVLFCNE